MVNLKIDNQEVTVKEGITILDAARDVGIEIPTLCYHKALLPYGACRLCTVEIKRGAASRLQASCCAPVEEGIEVITNSERIRRGRRMMIELLLAKCPNVKKIQELAEEYGVSKPRFTLNNEECILCGLCVRVCKERMGVSAINFVDRGIDMKVNTPFETYSEVCMTCGACAFVCPTGAIKLEKITKNIPIPILKEYEMGLSSRGAIYIPSLQSVPNVPVIDRNSCMHFLKGTCKTCESFCQAGAIKYDQQDEIVELEVGAVILAPGFDEFDTTIKKGYGDNQPGEPKNAIIPGASETIKDNIKSLLQNAFTGLEQLKNPPQEVKPPYKRYENVITSLQFERILSPGGPFKGTIARPSDGKHPKKIAFIQCVGSRDASCGNDYCSSVCCMYATKEAIIAKEHDSEIKPTIFYNDIRAHGKGFEYYYETAKNVYNVRYVKCLIPTFEEVPETKNLKIKYTLDNSETKEEEFDMVILSIGLVPSESAIELCKKIGVDTNKFGFCKTVEGLPNQTNIPGIYVAGVFEEPMDIPDSVLNASSAAGLAGSLLASERNTLVKEKVYPPEQDITKEEPRVGVFVCRCGTNIARVVGVPEAVEYARTLPGVVYAEENLYTCSTNSCQKITEKIKEYNINRLVVASCTPRTHESLFRDVLREAGINKYLFEMANIRDQCSWVHPDYPDAATKKAKDLIRMAVARAKTLKPLHESVIDISQEALVIGGGLSGIIAALSLSSQGFKTHLIEKDNQLGGNLRKVKYTLEGLDTGKYLNDLLARLKEDKKTTVYLNAEIVEFGGHVGKYKTKIKAFPDRQEIELEHGIVIVAAGGEEYIPTEYEYGKSSKIVTQLQIEALVKDSKLPENLKTVVMIQCVGSREENHMYCSRICCSTAIKNALKLKELKPDINVYILYRDIRTYGFKELYYAEARKKRIKFVRFEKDKKPEVNIQNDSLNVKVFDQILNEKISIKSDLLVLSSAIRPRADHDDLSTKLKVSCNMDGFYLEAHMKLRPLDFANEGMFLCGIGHGPKTIQEAIASAQGAAARAATIIARDKMAIKGEVSVVDGEKCAACLTCVRLCPFHVPYINKDGVACIEGAACQGCGVCVSACPRKAIQLQHYEDVQIIAKCEAICS